MAHRRTDILPAEKSALLKFISEAETRLSLCNAEASRLAELTKENEFERAQTKRSIDRCRSLLTPGQRRRMKKQSHIQQLAVELLTNIFKICCEDPAGLWLSEPVGLAPLNLALVCRQWRSIALDTPVLWSTFSVFLPENTTKRTADIVQLYLERSRQFPLTVEVEHPCREWDHPLGYSVARSIATQCRRIRSLKLIGDISVFDDLIEPEDLVTMETFIIENDSEPQYGVWDTRRQTSLKPLPMLQCLHLIDSPFPLELPSEQITSLQVTGLDGVHDVLSTLESFAELKHAKLDICQRSRSRFVQHVHTLTLEHLTTLSLNVAHHPGEHRMSLSGGALQHFFQSVTLPSLASATIMSASFDSDMECDAWVPVAFMGLLTRSQWVLKDITLRHIFITEFQLLCLFQAVPSLVDFAYQERQDLLETAITADLLNRLNLSIHVSSSSSNSDTFDSSAVMLPNLKRLEFTLASCFVDSKSLVHMIESRLTPDSGPFWSGSGCACLEEIDLTFATPIDEEDEKSLRDFGTHGLRVWIS